MPLRNPPIEVEILILVGDRVAKLRFKTDPRQGEGNIPELAESIGRDVLMTCDALGAWKLPT